MFNRTKKKIYIVIFVIIIYLYIHRFLSTLRHLRQEKTNVSERAILVKETWGEDVDSKERRGGGEGGIGGVGGGGERGIGGGGIGGEGGGGIGGGGGLEEELQTEGHGFEDEKGYLEIDEIFEGGIEEDEEVAEGEEDDDSQTAKGRIEEKEGQGDEREENEGEEAEEERGGEGGGDNIGKILEERKKKVEEYCGSHSVAENLSNTLFSNVFFLWNYNTSTCIMEKVGSMSWRRRICTLNKINVNTWDPKRKQLLKHPLSHVVQKVRQTKSIITVRHPLTRLVSCFRDKFSDGRRPPVHERHWQDFFLPTLITNGRISKYLHLRLGLQEPVQMGKQYSIGMFKKMDTLLQPTFTFTEFLRNVAQSFAEGRVNRHWNTYSAMCSPCTINYSYVTKLEEQAKEMDYIFYKTGLPKEMTDVVDHSTSTDQNKDDLYIRLYYSAVPLPLRKQIYEIYKTDFEMFDYQIPELFWEE